MEIRRLFLLEFLEFRREKLPIMNSNLFWSPWDFRLWIGCSTTCGQCLTIILVHRIRLFLSFTFSWIDPVNTNIFLSIREILSVPLVGIVRGELLEIVDAEFFKFFFQLCCPFLTLFQNEIDVIL